MLKKSILAAVAASTVLGAVSAQADPLMPDVPASHWATQAVRRLAEKNLIKGYPDGTFKGDRAATRYEVAMVISRVLAEMERNGASESEFEELQALIEGFQPELEALGVRVDELENTVGGFDARLADLERVSFYGEFATHLAMQSFSNAGNALNDGDIPVDLVSGRPLYNGTGLTMAGLLGVNFKINDSWDAGAEFSAFSSQGNGGVDPYWGLGAAYLNSPWTVGGIGNGDANSHSPFTRVNLDNVWFSHENFNLVLGSFADTNFSNFVYNDGQPNPSIYGGATNGSYGVDMTGDIELFGTNMDWELVYSRIPTTTYVDTGRGFGTNFENFALDSFLYGGNLGWNFDGGFVRLNYLKAQTEANEWEYDQIIGVPGTPQYNVGSAGLLVPDGIYNTNPNSTAIFGAEAAYDWALSDSFTLNLEGSFASSSAKVQNWANPAPARTPGVMFDESGTAWDIGLGFSLFNESLYIGGRYLTVEGSFDPVSYQYPLVAGQLGTFQPFPFLHRGANEWFLHDTEEYPHNRTGFVVDAGYTFNEDKGLAWGRYVSLDQESQVYVGGAPFDTTPLFYDAVFTAVDPAAGVTGDGEVDGWGLGLDYDFGKFDVALGYESYDYARASTVAFSNVDFQANLISVELGYDITDDFNLFGGVDISALNGAYNNTAGTADNLDHSQTVPYIGFQYDVTDNTAWDMDFRYFSTSGGANGVAAPVGGPVTSLGAGVNPVEFDGVQVNTTFSVKF